MNVEFSDVFQYTFIYFESPCVLWYVHITVIICSCTHIHTHAQFPHICAHVCAGSCSLHLDKLGHICYARPVGRNASQVKYNISQNVDITCQCMI